MKYIKTIITSVALAFSIGCVKGESTNINTKVSTYPACIKAEDNGEVLDLKQDYTSKTDELVARAKELRKKNPQEAAILDKKVLELGNEYFEVLKERNLKESNYVDIFKVSEQVPTETCHASLQ